MAPSPFRSHQWFSGKFNQKASNELDKLNAACKCAAYSELDWIIDEDTVVRPDCMIVCGDFTENFLKFPPVLIVEISSHSTRLRDSNTKYTLYEMKGVKYYIIADTEAKNVEVFELISGKYIPKTDTLFQLTATCQISLPIFSIWELM
jgi:Uma2 family endonuclease